MITITMTEREAQVAKEALIDTMSKKRRQYHETVKVIPDGSILANEYKTDFETCIRLLDEIRGGVEDFEWL